MMILNANPDKLKVEWKLGDLFWGRVGGGGCIGNKLSSKI